MAELPESAERAQLGAMACIQVLDVFSRLRLPEDEARAVFEQGRTLAAGDPRTLGALHAMYARFRGVNLGDVRSWIEDSQKAIRLATQAGDHALRLTAQIPLFSALMQVGRTREALELAEAMLREPVDGADFITYSPTTFARASRGIMLGFMGRLRDGVADLERAVGEAEHAPADLVGVIQSMFVPLALFLGDEVMAMAHAQRLLALAEKSPSRIVEGWALVSLGEVHLMRQEWSEAVAVFERVLASHREVPVHGWRLPIDLARLAEANAGAGNPERARALASQAVALVQERGMRMQEIGIQLSLARVLLRLDAAGARDAIEAALTRAELLTGETGLISNMPLVHLERAALARLTGDEAGRRRALHEAHRLFTEIGAPMRAEQVARELA